jgi:hypothetical protein
MMADKILIILEGKTDFEIIKKLIIKNNISDENKLEFFYNYGINDVYKYIENLSTISSITQNKINKLLIIVDCDDDEPNNRFLKITSLLKKQWKDLKKYNFSKIPVNPGIVNIEYKKIGIGIFLLPDNKNKGCLETLCLRSFRNNNILSCLDNYINCLNSKGENLNHNKIAKLKVKNYIYTINPDTYSATLDQQTDYLSSCFDDLKDFLKG